MCRMYVVIKKKKEMWFSALWMLQIHSVKYLTNILQLETPVCMMLTICDAIIVWHDTDCAGSFELFSPYLKPLHINSKSEILSFSSPQKEI